MRRTMARTAAALFTTALLASAPAMSASAATPSRADLQVKLTASQMLVWSGGTVGATVTVKNVGKANATTVRTTIVVPRGYSVIDSAGKSRSSVALFATSLPAGKSQTYKVTVRTPSNAGGLAWLGVATATTTPESNYTNNVGGTSILVL